MLTLRDAMDRLFEEAFVRPREMREGPALDIYETDDAIKVEVALPGVNPEEVDVTAPATH